MNKILSFIGKYFMYFIIALSVIIFSFLLIQANVAKKNSEVNSVSPATIEIIPISAQNPFTILIVPGHDTDNGGAKFNNIYERDLVVDIANNISTLLSQDPKYKIIVARDKQVWNPIFANYFANNEQAILDFKNKHQSAYKLLISSGQEKVNPDPLDHTTASKKTAIELYGINKWANENKVNLIIHLHFNNSTRRHVKLPGPRHGFDMFIPDKQNADATTSRNIAEDIYNELQKKFIPEAPGNYNSLFEDQSLIALGASGTLDKPAILIEYAYIYEKLIQTKEANRQKVLEQMAEQTVAGIQDYINSISSKN